MNAGFEMINRHGVNKPHCRLNPLAEISNRKASGIKKDEIVSVDDFADWCPCLGLARRRSVRAEAELFHFSCPIYVYIPALEQGNISATYPWAHGPFPIPPMCQF